MSDRGNFRGGSRGGGGRGGDNKSGRGGGGRGGGHGGQPAERPKKENILDLTKYMDKEVSVKFNGGREGMPSSQVEACWACSLITFFSHWHFERL